MPRKLVVLINKYPNYFLGYSFRISPGKQELGLRDRTPTSQEKGSALACRPKAGSATANRDPGRLLLAHVEELDCCLLVQTSLCGCWKAKQGMENLPLCFPPSETNK